MKAGGGVPPLLLLVIKAGHRPGYFSPELGPEPSARLLVSVLLSKGSGEMQRVTETSPTHAMPRFSN